MLRNVTEEILQLHRHTNKQNSAFVKYPDRVAMIATERPTRKISTKFFTHKKQVVMTEKEQPSMDMYGQLTKCQEA